MLLLVLISLAPLFTLQTEVFLNYNGFNPIATVPSASAAYNSASSGLTPTTRRLSTAATTTTYAQQQLQWPPAIVHNDWYILQAAANAAVAAVTTQADATPGNRLQKPHEAITQDKQPYSTPHNNYDTPHAVQQQLLQQNQLNYYTYNSSNSGNYRSPAQDTRFVAPYVLTVSNQRRPSMPSGEMSRRREHSNNTADNAVNNLNNRRYINNYYNKSASQHNKYGDNEQTATNKVNNAATIIAQPQHSAVLGWQDIESRNVGEDNSDGNGDRNVVDIEESMEVGSVENDINSLEGAQFDEVFVPLGNALDKIRNFCEVFRRIISDDEDFESDDLVTLGSSAEAFASTASVTTAQSAAVDTVISAGDNAQLLLEVQGQRSPPTATATTAAHLSTQQSQPTAAAALVWPTMTAPATPRSTAVTASAWATTNASSNILNSAKSLTSTALAIGRGKKLKKKLKKLMLPLLLAYKLKFIALVPLLIGGLTLLVGSTGLAGFFFALFLTVMSLKGGGSVNKSIVIKKVW
ncbi:uncharacterized protein LOC105212399 [Zeugodacus cucurbitae]|uniref:uncharacterized protein LOC105212399 n=1 Tax=Zeugodacus cucurbitae TaxID=28588 RepID=UPI0005969266|nr:uncharacterized protein LOC105212399 [Zeugodacus cucurbitae]